MEEYRYYTTSTYIARLVLYLGVIALALWMLRPFIMPLILAAITASIFLKLKPRVPLWLRKNSSIFAALATLTTLLVVVLPIFLVLLLAGLEAVRFVQFVQEMFQSGGFSLLSQRLAGLESQINAQLKPFGTSFHVSAIQQDALNQLQRLGSLLYNNALNLLNNTLMVGLNIFYFLFIAFFLIRDGERIIELIKQLLPFERKTTQSLVDAVEHVGQTVLLGGMVSALIFGGLMAIVFGLFGFTSPLMWGILLGILALIPFGTVVVYFPCLLYLVFTRPWWVALLFLVVVEVIEQMLYYVVIRPQLIDARTQMYPLAIFLAIVSGITSFGPMGLVYGPLIMAALLVLMEQQLRLQQQLQPRQPPEMPPPSPEGTDLG